MSDRYIVEFKDEDDILDSLDKDPLHYVFVEAIGEESDDYLVLDYIKCFLRQEYDQGQRRQAFCQWSMEA